MGKDSTLVAAMAIPKPISSTLPPSFPNKRRQVVYALCVFLFIIHYNCILSIKCIFTMPDIIDRVVVMGKVLELQEVIFQKGV